MDMVFDQMNFPKTLSQKDFEVKLPSPVIRLLHQSLGADPGTSPVFLDTILPLTPSRAEHGASCIVNQHQLNDIRFINKFLESVNERLPYGGHFIGCVATSENRKERILKKLPRPFNMAYYSLDYLIHRVWPKLPYLRRAYFGLTKGRNRVMSEMETYGRLYSCGFRLLDSIAEDGKLYFAVEKTGEPDYNTEATYGPFIALRRVGKNGKIVKVYKLRTMSPYSEYVQQFIYERNGAGGIGTGSKFNNDPRITTLGRVFRKYWIDELPMLYNLVRGDLKLFGVRPISKHYFSLYPEEFQEFRKKFKPGLIPPVYVEIPKSLADTVEIERRYLQAYERQPIRTDIRYFFTAMYNIFIKRVRSC